MNRYIMTKLNGFIYGWWYKMKMGEINECSGVFLAIVIMQGQMESLIENGWKITWRVCQMGIELIFNFIIQVVLRSKFKIA